MNEQFDIEKYIQSLPQNVQDFVDGSDWQNRVEEIGKKYNLNEEQTESLVNNTLLFLVGIGNPNEFAKILQEDLSISVIVSEQIIEDLDKRIFEYAINMTQEKKNNKIPEVRPQNLPAVEKVIEKVVPTPQPTPQKVSTPVYTPTYKPVSTVKNEEVKPTSISPSPETPTKKEEDWLADLTEKPFIGKDFGGSKITYKTNSEEIVQKPTTVPRFSLDQVKEAVVPKQNIAENKLNIPTSSTIQPPTPHQEIPKKYSVDPYREPIE